MRLLSACIATTLISMAAVADTHPAYLQDPDPASIDRAHPPGMIELQIPSGGAMMNGHLYLANGAEPHPTVVMLHGFPGNEKNLDTAQVLRRAGFNVLYFHYRGAWGSGGDYSLGNITEDAAAALAFLRDKAPEPAFRVDPARLSIVGHSLGGFNALYTGAADQDVKCTVAAAPADLVNFVEHADPKIVVSEDANTPVPGLKDYSFADLIRDTQADKPRYTLKTKMAAFRERPLMIVTGDHDVVVPPEGQAALALAARAAGAKHFNHVVLDGDHGFAWSRVTFNATIADWMLDHCR